MCYTSLQLSSRIFWIPVKFHSNSCRCWHLTDWTARSSDFCTEQLFFQQLVEFFAVYQINHYPVDWCGHNPPHNLLGQWFIWWMVLLIQSSNSKYLRVKIQLLLPSHRRSNLKSECLSCMYNWCRYKFKYRKIEIKIKIIIVIIIRPSAGIRASGVQQSISTDNHNYLIWAPLHSTCTCVGIHCTPVWWLTFLTFFMITSCSILYVNKY